MEVILLERIAKLGQMGDVVRVRDGYARNFLLPQKKAMRATAENRKEFESQRAHLEARNLELKREADQVAERLDGQTYIVIRQAGDTGQLYGSVSSRDVAEAVTEGGITLDRRQVLMTGPIKELGMTTVKVQLHPEVVVTINVNVARSTDEADRQARGEDVTVIRDEALDLETFDPEAMDEADEE
ncbi:MAG: 50S ribosomal protein L9 [Hyphomicrobiaceae bacterium]